MKVVKWCRKKWNEHNLMYLIYQAEVRWSIFLSKKTLVFGLILRQKPWFANFYHIYPPSPLAIHGWKAMDLTFNSAPILRILPAVRIFMTHPDRFLNSSWHCVLPKKTKSVDKLPVLSCCWLFPGTTWKTFICLWKAAGSSSCPSGPWVAKCLFPTFPYFLHRYICHMTKW